MEEAKLAKFKKIITAKGAVAFSSKSPKQNTIFLSNLTHNTSVPNEKVRCIVAGEIIKGNNEDNIDYFRGYINHFGSQYTIEYIIATPTYWELKKLLCPKDYKTGAMYLIEIENEYLELFESLFVLPDTLAK